jgi:hypothetical protein
MSWRTETVEKALGVKIPEQYGNYLDKHGIYHDVGIEIYGIKEDLLGFDGVPCVIGATESLRRLYDLPTRFVALECTGLEDEHICLDTEDGKVYSISRCFGDSKIADSFDEWFYGDIIGCREERRKSREAYDKEWEDYEDWR